MKNGHSQKDLKIGFQDQLLLNIINLSYSKICVKRPLSKRPKIGFQDQLSLNTGQKYCRMLQGEHSAILSTFIKLPFVIKIFVFSIFEWQFYTGFTVLPSQKHVCAIRPVARQNNLYKVDRDQACPEF